MVAGNALNAYGDQLRPGSAALVPDALPRAIAMLPLANQLLSQGGAVDAAQALPIYLRDKVALTSAERAAGEMFRAGA